MEIELRTGDILICKSDRLISKIIQNVTNSEWNHTAQIIEINGKIYVIDAQKEGVIPRLLSFWNSEYGYKYEVYRKKTLIKEIYFIDNAMQYCGINYDKGGLGSGLFRTLFSFKTMPDKYRSNGKFWCSEYTMKLLGVQDPEEYSPQKVREYLISNDFLLVGKNY